MVKLEVPMVIEPMRETGLVFFSTEYWANPFPVPVDEVIAIQETFGAGIQAHPCGDKTVIDPDPPEEPMVAEVGESEVVQFAPVWVIGKVVPETERLPDRWFMLGFGPAV